MKLRNRLMESLELGKMSATISSVAIISIPCKALGFWMFGLSFMGFAVGAALSAAIAIQT